MATEFIFDWKTYVRKQKNLNYTKWGFVQNEMN